MGLFTNPLSHAGYPPGVTGTPTTQPSAVRAATAAEAAAGVLTDVYISPATADSATALDFASPPVLGFGSTTPRPVHATTLDSTGLTSIATGAGAVANIGNATGSIGFFGATAVVKPASNTDLKTALVNLGLYTTGGASPLNLNGGALTAGSVAATTIASTATITAGTSLAATLGNITATNGNIVRGTAGNKDVYSSVATTTAAGANSAGTVTLVGGTATVATTAITASSQIRLYRQGVGATGAAALGILTIGTISAGVSFVINAVQAADATALQASDVSSIGWEIVN